VGVIVIGRDAERPQPGVLMGVAGHPAKEQLRIQILA